MPRACCRAWYSRTRLSVPLNARARPWPGRFKTSSLSQNHLNIEVAARESADPNGTASGVQTDLRFDRLYRASPTGLAMLISAVAIVEKRIA
eukprot:4898277-Pleurochrysis_carterae.AAC.1